MRRPALLIAGMLLATGTGLALAAPASAADSSSGGDSSRWHCQRHSWNDWNRWDNGPRWGAQRSDATDHRRRDCRDRRHWRGHWRGGNWSVGTVSGGVLVSAGR
jgi:Spy/CpxP family protein refolding chaperone